MGFDLLDMVWFGSMSDMAARDCASTSRFAASVRAHGLRLLDSSARRLIELTEDPSYDREGVLELVATDPVMAATALHIANAVGAGSGARCTTLDQAIDTIGRRRLHYVARRAADSGALVGDGEREKQWAVHAVTVAELCRELAKPLGLPSEELYASGLVHDIGKWMLLQADALEYARMLDRCEREGGAIHVREREKYGFDHGILAGQVLADWLVPKTIVSAISAHHGFTGSARRQASRHALLLGLADRLAPHVASRVDAEFFDRQALAHEAVALELSAAMLQAHWPGQLLSLAPAAPSELATVLSMRAPSLGAGSIRAPSIRSPSIVPRHSMHTSLRAAAVSDEQRCGVCGQPSLAASCPRCHSFLCSAHEPRRTAWCVRCENEFRQRFGSSARFGVVLAVAVVGIGLIAAALPLAGAPPAMAAIFAVIVFVVLSVAAAWLRWHQRAQFAKNASPSIHERADTPKGRRVKEPSLASYGV